MLHQFLISRFGETGWPIAMMSIIGVLAGVALWLIGSRFSRSIVTLIAVSIGALVGLRLPSWFAIPLGTWSTAIGGALLLGVTGYVLHRMWVGAGLAALLAIWAMIMLWNVYVTGHISTFPQRVAGMGIGEYWARVWSILPADFRNITPILCSVAIISGIVVAFFWSRAAAVMLYSFLGVSLLWIMGSLGIAISKPQLLGLLPTQTATQILTLGGMVLFGALVQWYMTPRTQITAPNVPENRPHLSVTLKNDPINQITT